MNVFTFGWEFPPTISGGLGTACYGLIKGQSKLNDVEVTFVIPKLFHGEEKSNINLIGASDILCVNRRANFKEFVLSVEFIGVSSNLATNVDSKNYMHKAVNREGWDQSRIEVDLPVKEKSSVKHGSYLLSQLNHLILEESTRGVKKVYKPVILMNSIGIN